MQVLRKLIFVFNRKARKQRNNYLEREKILLKTYHAILMCREMMDMDHVSDHILISPISELYSSISDIISIVPAYDTD